MKHITDMSSYCVVVKVKKIQRSDDRLPCP
jgi:hypothetical protein